MVLNNTEQSIRKFYSLTWSEFNATLTTTAQNLRRVEDLTDVTLSAGGKIFPAHKLILSAASPLLMELLKNTKCHHPILMFAGISAVDLETILDFVYRGEINVDSDKLASFLQAAQFLDIRALLPTSLVLSASENVSTTPTINSEDAFINETNIKLSTPSATLNEINNNEQGNKDNKSKHPTLKRKLLSKPIEKQAFKMTKPSCPTTKNNQYQVHNSKDTDEMTISIPTSTSQPTMKVSTPVKLKNTENQEGLVFDDLEEKKIISDLPVNCKLCGVTIRQSRNLRRHIDQMHLKTKLKSKEKEKDARTNRSITSKRSNEQSTDAESTLMDDFSQDSFSQLTEEILNYSAASSESDESTFTNAITSSSIEPCSIDNSITNSLRTSPSNSISAAQTLPALLEDDICFQLAAKNNSNLEVISETRVKIDSNSAEQFECSNLDDSCQVNDVALKELENQFFSVCFCSTENM